MSYGPFLFYCIPSKAEDLSIIEEACWDAFEPYINERNSKSSSEFSFKIKNHKTGVDEGVSSDLGSFAPGQFFKEPAVIFQTEFSREFMGSDFTNENLKNLHIVAKSVLAKTDVLASYVAHDDDLVSSSLEYYHDPYYFAILPSIEDKSHTFLYDKRIQEQLAQFKEVLPLDDLISILKERSHELIQGKNGIGVIKPSDLSSDLIISPRYYVRQELCNRGVEMAFSYVEEQAKRIGVIENEP